VISAYCLANSLHELGQYEQDRKLGENVLARCRRVLGEDHPQTLRAAATVAASLAYGEHERDRQLDQ
jgi:hypothetical protein